MSDIRTGSAPARNRRRATSELATTAVSGIGLWLLLSCIFPESLGWRWVADRAGGDLGLLRLLTAFLFLYFAGIAREKNVLRRTLDGLMAIIRVHLGSRRPPDGEPDPDATSEMK